MQEKWSNLLGICKGKVRKSENTKKQAKIKVIKGN